MNRGCKTASIPSLTHHDQIPPTPFLKGGVLVLPLFKRGNEGDLNVKLRESPPRFRGGFTAIHYGVIFETVQKDPIDRV